MVFDLKEGKQIDLPGMPKYDKSHQDRDENALYDISPDGRYVIGMISQAFWMDGEYAPLCCYVYDIQEGTYDMIGYDDYLDKDWVPKVEDLHFTISPQMSNNGEWITGMAYLVHYEPGNEWPVEGYHPFRYNVRDKSFEVYNGVDDTDVTGTSIDNLGTVYGCTPAQNPYPSAVVRSGKYFITFEDIMHQIYGVNLSDYLGDYNSGKVRCISDDGTTLIVAPDPDSTYILRVPQPLGEVAGKVKLLGNYHETPEQGVKLSRLTKITLVFDRKVVIRGKSSSVTFSSKDGKESYTPVADGGVTASDRRVTITFRTRQLSDGEEYTLSIPAGLISMDGNEEETNEEINLTYYGRANTPVQVEEIQPTNDAYVAQVDATSNPILIRFDTQLKLADGAHGFIYRNDETNPFCMLYMTMVGRNALIYPAAGQRLYLDSDYHFLIPAGTFTDISDGGPNEEIRFSYHGSYEREIPANGSYIFFDDAADYNQMLFFDGDGLQPSVIPAGWGFTSDASPWLIVRDEGGYDMAFASHSMYTPEGQSDDWMVTSQLMIPNEKCYLDFDAQSYMANYDDVLKVIVYPCENVYNTLTADIVADFKKNGEVIFEEVLDPGDDDDILEDQWTHYSIPLAKYANKPVYIAFVNQNDDQSAIFLDNIAVKHEQSFYTSFTTPARVVAQESVPVSGDIIFDSEHETFDTIRLTLLDSDDTEIETIRKEGLSLTKGDVFNFKFDKELPLKPGENNIYYVDVYVSDGKTSGSAKLTGKVSNLIFQPERKIVLEEYTGSECPNCPLGICALENLEKIYPGSLIPITIRTYQNDRYGIGMGAYSQALGLEKMGAPSAIIDRKEAGYPMINVNMDYRFSGVGVPSSIPGKDERVWLDIVRDEYESPAELAIDFKNSYNADKDCIDVKVDINNALNLYRASYKVFAVITEEGLTTYQRNNLGSVADPDFGEWGLGGKNSGYIVTDVECHGVARQTWGTTHSGTSGLFPSAMTAGQKYSAEFSIALPSTIENLDNCNVVVMILDGGTNQVLNANIAPVNGSTDFSGILPIAEDADEANVGMAVVDGKLIVNPASPIMLAAYDVNGSAMISTECVGYTELPLYGFKGILLVKATDKEGRIKTAKYLVM